MDGVGGLAAGDLEVEVATGDGDEGGVGGAIVGGGGCVIVLVAGDEAAGEFGEGGEVVVYVVAEGADAGDGVAAGGGRLVDC